jgi:lysophospholipase L1-like esterase
MYNKLLFLLIINFIITHNNIHAQKIRPDINKIFKREHLNLFYNKLNKKQDVIKILHLGDSHIMIGHFSNEIRRILDSAFGIISYGWTFPNQIAKYNTLYTNSKLNTGKTSFFNNLYKEGLYQNGIAGQSIQLLDTINEIEFSLKNVPSKFQFFNTINILYQSDSNVNLTLYAFDTTDINIKKDSLINSPPLINFYPKKEQISTFTLNNNYNKIKINVKKTDTSSLFNLLGIYLGNNNITNGIVYNSLGVSGSNLNSIVNNNSLLIGDITTYKPDLIILSYGSNDVYRKSFDEKDYKDKIDSFIYSVSKTHPNVCFLITSPPVSRYKNKIPINFSKIKNVFIQVALKNNNVAYWDLRTIMGSNTSILKLLKLKLASFDKLHYTKDGYILQANLLMNAMLKN